jgi:Na+-driven multidrug efflux pump
VWYAVITMIVNVFAQGMLVQNQQRRLLIIKVVGVLLNVGFNLLTVLWLSWGVYGLVIASVVAELLTLQVMFLTFREVGTNMLRLTRKLALLAIVGLGVAGVMMGVGAVASPLLAIMIGVGLYAVLMMRLPILDAEEWDLLYRLLASIPIGKYILHIWHRQVRGELVDEQRRNSDFA